MASFLLTSSYHISCAKLDTVLTDVRNSQTFGPSNISKPYEFKPAKLSYFMFNQSNSRLFSQRVSKKESGITSDETSEPEKPSRRGRKKGTLSVPASRKDKKNEEEKSELEDEGEGEQNIEANRKHIASSKKTKRSEDKESDSEENLESDKIKPRRRRKASVLSSSGRNKKSVKNDEEFEDDEEEDYDDGTEFPYESPPLVCCFGAARREFIPTVRISDRQMDPDKYSTWKNLQWSPPEFARAPGGPPSNVAISHCRLGGRAAFIGKVGDDDFGKDLVYRMNLEKVQTRGTKIDSNVKTSISYMKLRFENGKIKANVEKECAENSLTKSELNLSILREAKIFHFNSEVLASPSMHSALFKAIRMSKKFGGLIFFDLNLSLPLWRSRDETREIISKAWNQSNIIEVTKQELEFLLDEDYYEKMRNYTPQYFSETYDQTKKRRGYYHYTKEEISPLWHDDIKIMFVTDGTLRIHYYTPDFDGVVIGTEDVLITPFTCDRTGSGDAVTAGIMRKLTTHPEMYNDQDILERHLRFAIAAGIISQWTIGAVRGFPTESATQNLKEQVYVPSMW